MQSEAASVVTPFSSAEEEGAEDLSARLVLTWPGGRSIAEAIQTARQAEVTAICLAVSDWLDDVGDSPDVDVLHDALQAVSTPVREAGLRLSAGWLGFMGEEFASIATARQTVGFVPDAAWPSRRERLERAARIANRLGLTDLGMYVGHVPPSSGGGYRTLVDRVADAAGLLSRQGCRLLIETGPDAASDLLQFLNDLPSRTVGLRFDPGAFVRYGTGDPAEALRILAHRVRFVRLSDAIAGDQPGVTWGENVPLGHGVVDFGVLFQTLRDIGYTGPVAVMESARQSAAHAAAYARSKQDDLTG